jgi:hypothetical protein
MAYLKMYPKLRCLPPILVWSMHLQICCKDMTFYMPSDMEPLIHVFIEREKLLNFFHF